MTNTPIYLEQSDSQIYNFDENCDINVCVAWETTKTNVKCADSLCMEMFFVSTKKAAITWQKNEHLKKRDIYI